jgi:uncharacterized caspase-like protein
MGKFSRTLLLGLFVGLALGLASRAGYAQEVRFTLVIGNDQYKSAKLATPANDAGLVADALQNAGFTVTGARNLDQATLRQTLREFLDQVSAAGPNAVVVIYLAGIGLQLAGDNYFVPVDADIRRDVDVPLQAIRISDFSQPSAALPGRAKIIILDAARQNPFAGAGQPLASGLALVDPAQSLAMAFNAAPGTVAPDEQGPYGAYATALTEMIASGGLDLNDLFARVRLRVSDLTQGAEVPWYASQIDGPFFFTERAAEAPPPPNVMALANIGHKPMREFGSVEDGYAAALALDTIDGYEQFVAVYPNSPFSPRIAAMLAVRREEIIWRRCVTDDTPSAYWSYLRRYPHGPHVWDARRRLAILRAETEPPPDFAFVDFGRAAAAARGIGDRRRPILVFAGPSYRPPPPLPLFFLPPRPREFVALPPPPPPRERFFLPIPAAVAIPAFVRPPRTVSLPPAPRAATPISLPAAGVSFRGPEGRPQGPGAAAPTVAPLPRRPGGAPPAPSTALVKPVPPPPRPPHPGPAPAMVKPVRPPPPPHPAPATVKPVRPPPPPHPAPATVKPVRPPPPPHPAPAASPAKPAPCPPGKRSTPAGCK